MADDARAFVQSCEELGVPAALEVSRSGQGAHAWVFFVGEVSARDARRLGTAIISHTCARTRQLKLASYDRLFPNQDTMPKGGFGNLIALPLQKQPARTRLQRVRRRRSASVPGPVGVPGVDPAHGAARHRADHPARDRRRSSAGRHLHRR